MLHCNSFIK